MIVVIVTIGVIVASNNGGDCCDGEGGWSCSSYHDGDSWY